MKSRKNENCCEKRENGHHREEWKKSVHDSGWNNGKSPCRPRVKVGEEGKGRAVALEQILEIGQAYLDGEGVGGWRTGERCEKITDTNCCWALSSRVIQQHRSGRKSYLCSCVPLWTRHWWTTNLREGWSLRMNSRIVNFSWCTERWFCWFLNYL